MTLVIVLLIVLLLAGVPWGGYHSYGYGPSGAIGLIVLFLLILLLLGYI